MAKESLEHDRLTDLTILDEEPGAFSFFRYKNVTIIVWITQATGPAIVRLSRVTMPVANDVSGGFSNLHLIKAGALLPTVEARKGLVDLGERLKPTLKCVGVALLGGGFWASALQSVITSMWMLAKHPCAMKFDRSLDALAEWLPPEHLTRTGVTLEVEELRAILHQAVERASSARAPQAAFGVGGPPHG